MAKERRFEKRGYLRYIHRDASGAYVYTGGYYVLQGGTYRAFLGRLFLFAVPIAACVAAAGSVPNPAMGWLGPNAKEFNAFYTIIPYILEVAFTGSILWAAMKILTNERPLREYVYHGSVPRFSLRCILTAAAAGLTMAGETVFLILHGPMGQTWSAVLAYVLHAAVLALALLLRRYVGGTVWRFSKDGK